MKKLITIMAAACCIVASTFSTAQNSSAEVQAYFDSLSTLQANFTQVVFDAKGQQIENSSGVLKLGKPGRAHWDYKAPYRQQLVTNGQKVWFYDMDLDQVTIRSLKEFTGQLPTSLLTGAKPIASEFNLKQLSAMSDQIKRWSLTPKSKGSEFKSMLLGFSPTGQLTRIEVVNQQDQLTMLNLSNVRENPGIPSSTFEFKVPKGVDVFQ